MNNMTFLVLAWDKIRAAFIVLPFCSVLLFYVSFMAFFRRQQMRILVDDFLLCCVKKDERKKDFLCKA